MKKLLLLVLVVGGLQAMDELPEGYGKEDCLLEIQQMELALKLLKIGYGIEFKKRCPKCAHRSSDSFTKIHECEKCSTKFKEQDVNYSIRENAIQAIVIGRRALLYKFEAK